MIQVLDQKTINQIAAGGGGQAKLWNVLRLL